jgi:predicted RNase H-like HicB family nuclease
MVRYSVIYERGDRNWSAYVPDLSSCIATGKDRQESRLRIREAIEFHIEGLREVGEPVPLPTTEVDELEVSG